MTSVHLEKIHIRGFRNIDYIKTKINQKSLIIGRNDIGKSNILDAIRLILDTEVSEEMAKPKDSDFNQDSRKFTILLEFGNVSDDVIKNIFKVQEIDLEKKLYIAYRGLREGQYMTKDFKMYAFNNLSKEEIPKVLTEEISQLSFGTEIFRSQILKHFQIRYVNAFRDFSKVVENDIKTLFVQLMQDFSSTDIKQHKSDMNSIINILEQDVQPSLQSLQVVKETQKLIDEELKALSKENLSQKIHLGIDFPNVSNLLDKLKIIPIERGTMHERKLGGQGRINQIYFVLWLLLNRNSKIPTLYIIEEPEAHLHPHQQKQISYYLNNVLKEQLIVTSHSPYILSDFPTQSIIRLYTESGSSHIKINEGNKIGTYQAIEEMEFRKDIQLLETFFSDCVLLVEGPSEALFYRVLARQLDIDLDFLNISICSVNGVGFNQYVNLYKELGIPFVIRTDNDISSYTKKNDKYYILLGLRRAVKLAKVNPNQINKNGLENLIQSGGNEHEQRFPNKDIAEAKRFDLYHKYNKVLAEYFIFLSEKDLETDLYMQSKGTVLEKDIIELLKLKPDSSDEKIIKAMQDKKATFMYKFTKEYGGDLVHLKDCKLAEPLFACKKICRSN